MALNRRPDIQALRGVAVLAVMLSHFGGVLPAGFIGVDLFFAISGFVITLSFIRLREKHQRRRVILQEFWTRRFWRLFPALSVTLAFTITAAAFFLPPHAFREQLEMSAWSAFFAGNIGVEVISQPNYFDPASGENWLLHLWSLGVEEQFYLLFPIAMLALLGTQAGPTTLRKVSRWVLVGGLISLLIALLNDGEKLFLGTSTLETTTGVSAVLGYYSPLTRAWEFCVGVLAALHVLGKASSARSTKLSAIGAALVLMGLILTPESSLLPGPATVIPMVGIYVLLRWPMHSLSANSFFAKSLRWLGDRSYSAYLWHWPVWAVLTELLPTNLWTATITLTASLALAHTTYTLVELRFIDLRFVRIRRTRALTGSYRAIKLRHITFLALPAFIGFAIVVADFSAREAGWALSRQKVAQIEPAINCFTSECAEADIDVLLVGDSHAGAIAGALQTELADRGHDMFGYVRGGCLHLPSSQVSVNGAEDCQIDRSKLASLLDKSHPNIVVLFGYSAGRFTSINSGGLQEIALVFASNGQQITEETGPSAYEMAVTDSLDLFTSREIPVVLVSGVPDFSFRPEEVAAGGTEASMVQRLFNGASVNTGQTINKETFLERHAEFIEIDRRAAATQPLVTVINGWDTVCVYDECSQVTADQQFLFSDQDHLGPLGASRIAAAIADVVANENG